MTSASQQSEPRGPSRSRRSRRRAPPPTNGDDAASASTASTFSFLHSILERRRHIQPEGGDDGALNDRRRPSSRGHRPPPPRGSGGAQRTRRHGSTSARDKAPHQRRARRPALHPLVAVALVGAASNWMASRILNAMLFEDGEYAHGGKGEAINAMPVGSNSGHDSYEQWPRVDGIKSVDGHNNDYTHMRGGGASSKRTNKANPMDLNLDEKASGQPPQPTKRFVNLRRRLLSLYSERVPSAPSANQSTPALHPLYDAASPQYRALHWLSNVDARRLRHYDPGLVQRYVLAVLYFATGGPVVEADADLSRKRRGAWRNPTNFLAPTHECEWKSRIMDGAGRGGGIRRCDRNQTVVEISIYNELSGTLPTELGRLWNLRTLYLGRNKITGTIPTELGMIQKLSSLSLQHNELSGTLPERHLKNLLTLRALQVEGNEKLVGNLHRHSLLCQMRNKYRGPTPKGQERYTGRRVLRILTATCIPSGSSVGVSDRLECACCTECFGKNRKDQPY